MPRRSLGICGILIALIAVVAWSQQPPPPPGGGFFGPGGGPPGGGLMGLIQIPEVQKELSLEDPEKRKLDEVLGKQREEMQTLFQSFNPQALGDLNEEAREKK